MIEMKSKTENEIEKLKLKQEHSEIITTSITLFGKENQKIHSIQELTELVVAITKEIELSTSENRENVLEELIDVQIISNQLIRIYGFTQKELTDMKNLKMNKLKRIVNERL